MDAPRKFVCAVSLGLGSLALGSLACGSETPSTNDGSAIGTAGSGATTPGDALDGPSGLAGGAIRCSFFFRPDAIQADPETDLAAFEFQERVVDIAPGQTQMASLSQLTLTGSYADSAFEGSSFNLRVTAGDVQLLATLFQFSDGLPQNQFAGGHGFTGLLHLTHPTDGGNYQAFCEAVAE